MLSCALPQVNLLVALLLMCHLMACIWRAIVETTRAGETMDELEPGMQYVHCLYTTMLMVFGDGWSSGSGLSFWDAAAERGGVV